MFEMDALRTSRERYLPAVTLGPLEEVFGTFLQKPKIVKQVTLLCFRPTFGKIKLKIMQLKYIYTRGSKLTPWGRPKDATLRRFFRDALRRSAGCFC